MHKLKSSPQDYNARILWHFLVDAEQQTNGLYINKSTVHVPLAFSQTHYIIFASGNVKCFKRCQGLPRGPGGYQGESSRILGALKAK